MLFSENELISQLQGRNRNAFEYLVRNYTKPAYYIAHCILEGCGTKEDIEECVSDVFVQVWQRIDDFDPTRGSFKTWIHVLAKYRALEYKRTLTKQRVDNLEDYQALETQPLEQQVFERQEQEKLVETINTFSDMDRELFIRRYYFGESIRDLMAALGLSRSAVDNRLLRGRKIIKEVFSHE